METGRYNRQELINGWDQEKLKNSRVVVVGSGTLANFTLSSLASLGIGNIEIYDNAKVSANPRKEYSQGEFLLFESKPNQGKTEALETILRKINPETKIKGLNLKLEKSPMVSLIGKPALIVDATNSSASKETLLKYAQTKNIPVMSVASDSQNSELKIVMPGEDYVNAMLKAYNGRAQGAIPSEVMAGVLTEEARKILMPLQNESVVKSLAYSAGKDSRFSKSLEQLSEEIHGDFKGKKVLVIGAGALGNFVGLGLSLAGVENVDLLDYDDVEATNLNRQVLFYDAVGRKKSEALAEKLNQINPDAKVRGIVGKLDVNSKIVEKGKYDLIMDCVDSFAVRAVINYFAIRNNTPLVSGGTDPNAGQVSIYVPGESACLDCKLGVEKALAKQMASSSCRYAPDPSVIMTNEIIGGIMVGEAMKILDPKYGKPVTRILKYDSKAPSRGGLIGIDDKCDCEKPEAKEWLEQVKAKYVPEVK